MKNNDEVGEENPFVSWMNEIASKGKDWMDIGKLPRKIT